MIENKCVIFDFDGTIADTFDAIIRIYNSIATKHSCHPIEMSDIEGCRSEKMLVVMKRYGVSSFKLPFLSLEIKKKLKQEIDTINTIPDIKNALFSIKSEGYNLGIMTSNTVENVNLFLEKHNLSSLFDFVYSGKNIFGKGKVVSQLLKEQSIRKENAVYIGDETRDIEALNHINVPIVAVSWGFNSRTALEEANPTQIAHTPNDLLMCINKVFGKADGGISG